MANFAAAAAKPHSIASFRVPSRTGRSGFGQLGTNLAVEDSIMNVLLQTKKKNKIQKD